MSDPIHIISLGAGVQSSTMALMAAVGEITPMPVAAIFADTQAEPKSVYVWLDWLEKQLPFPVHRVTAGDLAKAELRVRRSKKSHKLYLDNNIPAFVKKPDGKIGLLGRKCTSDYKIIPIQRKVKEMLGIKRDGPSVPKSVMWIGISSDEWQRMKPSRVNYIENDWPLVSKGITRTHCLYWMKVNGFPVPPRSACRFCPFHGEEEWERMRVEEPTEFDLAVRFERDLQLAATQQEVLMGVPYLHESCLSLDKINFDSIIKEKQKLKDQQPMLFASECEGMCGV